jgi:hypothetical protein
MLLGALGSGLTTLGLIALSLMLGVASSLKFGTGPDSVKPWWLRIAVGAATLGALAYVASTVGGVSGFLAALRGPMPDLLMLLLIVHGLGVIDQRTQRVHQAIAGVIVVYAAGLRIDGSVGWWLAAWAVVIVIAVRTSTRIVTPSTGDKRHPDRISNRRFAKGVGLAATASLVILAVLSFVPVPDGPTRLGLPTLSNNAPSAPAPGALAGPDGNPAAASTDRRGSLAQVGGYPGFSNTLDTSVRGDLGDLGNLGNLGDLGDLGDELVMRVRASEPAFWRGQTFTQFDGRTWSASPEEGTRRAGPKIDVPATLGDLPRPAPGVQTERFIQTYYIESDLPNVIFAASRADVLTFDGSVWTRPDGSMRSNVTPNKGSVYTVVSDRVQVTPDLLQRQGDVATTFAAIDNPELESDWRLTSLFPSRRPSELSTSTPRFVRQALMPSTTFSLHPNSGFASRSRRVSPSCSGAKTSLLGSPPDISQGFAIVCVGSSTSRPATHTRGSKSGSPRLVGSHSTQPPWCRSLATRNRELSAAT